MISVLLFSADGLARLQGFNLPISFGAAFHDLLLFYFDFTLPYFTGTVGGYYYHWS